VRTFYLGTHKAGWLAREEFRGVPLMLSHQQLQERAHMPESVTTWMLDSGGFTQLSSRGPWPAGAEAPYVDAVRRYAEAGGLEVAWPQDWMCEPWVIQGGLHQGRQFPGTGLTVEDHQQLTVENFCTLTQMAPELPWRPVLQGWELADYMRAVDLYAANGVDLWAYDRVGLGSVCRRQATAEIGAVVREVATTGLPLHGFGVKTQGLLLYGHDLDDADSMAWSVDARWQGSTARPADVRGAMLPECSHGLTGRGSCANCPRWALTWRERLLEKLTVVGGLTPTR
jgi:hypothetical protein